ncbi:MAG: ribbon-helix-helix domain-containing protein [Methanomassiliicoccaceae archaeon]|nr:ribbon-helix-helix domain-containing protein [Methanomassiliicoccaceae archaeon]MCL2145592.1 ribbon-helix-helix domain-containing protein [Methanomassiliicoccaceae archaeon]
MERKNRTTVVTLRVPEGLIEKVDQDVERFNDFSSRADFIIVAIRSYLEERTEAISERNKAFSDERTRAKEESKIAARRTDAEDGD